MASWDYLFDDEPAKPAKTDMGPEARRARAGMPPSPGTGNPDTIEPQYGRVGGREPGRLPLDEPHGPGPAHIYDPTKYRGIRPYGTTELEGDPVVQTMLGTALTAPMAAGTVGLAGSTGGIAARTVVVPIAGAVQGAAIAGPMSGGGKKGAKEGAVLGAVFSLPAALESIGAAMKPGGPLDAGVVQDLSRNAPPETLQSMRRDGYAKTAETSRRFGVVGAKNATSAYEGVRSGLDAVGGEIGNVYGTIGNEYAPNVGSVMSRANRVQQSMRGTVAGNEVADAIHEQMQKFYDAHGGTAVSDVPLRTLREELTNAQKVGYSGAKLEKLPETARKVVAREWGAILSDELQSKLALAKQDPRFASQIDRLKDLNATYSSLKTLEETTARAMDREMRVRPPTLRERFSINTPEATKPVQMPTGRRMGTIGEPMRAPMVEPLAPGLAAALNKKNSTEINTELRNILIGARVAP